MKTFLSALIVVAAIGLVSDFVFGGSVSKSGVFGEEITEASGIWGDTSSAAANVSAEPLYGVAPCEVPLLALQPSPRSPAKSRQDLASISPRSRQHLANPR